MPDTRFTLIGKVCVWAVRSTDAQLRSVLKKGGWKGVSLTKRKSKRGGKKKRKARFKKGSLAAKRYMASIRPT